MAIPASTDWLRDRIPKQIVRICRSSGHGMNTSSFISFQVKSCSIRIKSTLFYFLIPVMMILSASQPLSNGKASTLEHQIDIPGKPADFCEPRHCTGFWLVCFMGLAGWGCVNQKPQAARFHWAKGGIMPQSSRVQNQPWMAGVHSAFGGGGWGHGATQKKQADLLHGNLTDGVEQQGSYLLFFPIYSYRWPDFTSFVNLEQSRWSRAPLVCPLLCSF